MPVLTNFLSVRKLSENEDLEVRRYNEKLAEQHKAFSSLQNAFDVEILYREDFGHKLYDKELETLAKLFDMTNFIPEEFKKSCFGGCYSYIDLFEKMSMYPLTKVSQLKNIADALSFVILPIEYVDIAKIIKMYREADSRYESVIHSAYFYFIDLIERSVRNRIIKPQQIYILAPLSFYDAWREVTQEKVLPKYFSSKLLSLSTTLGLIIPTQRNLYKITSTNSQNIREMKETMDTNFQLLQQSIDECHRRIDWVEGMVRDLNSKIHEIELRQAELEVKIMCLLDPIIFAVDSDVDISKLTSDNANARIGLCFGPEMPIEFFVQKGLATIYDKRFDKVTKIFNPHIRFKENFKVNN